MANEKDWRSEDHDPEGCPGCRPMIFDPQTGRVEERLSTMAGKAFDRTTPAERRAWHRFTCLNSRDPIDITLARRVADRIEAELNRMSTQ